MANPLTPPSAISFAEAFRFWLKLGFISFGGPAGQIAIVHQELVERRRWISERRFLHALNYCMVLPGPEAQQLATYLGWLMHRTWGGIVAGALFVLPSLFILILLSWIYLRFGNLPIVAGLFYGIKPAVVAIVVQATHRMGARTLHTRALWAVAGVAFVANTVLSLPFPFIVAGAALAGYLGERSLPGSFALPGAHSSIKAQGGPALIDDDSERPEHTRFRSARLLKVVLAGALLWLIPTVALTLMYGWSSTLTQMGWFFTKAALLTFGGAYAVLPYVFHGAVEHYGWLSAAQMLDGLALGETTPGPLIMIVAFVGFVGGHAKEVLGPDALAAGGIIGACVATWYTFLPSFIFILAGGPLVESSRGEIRLAAPLNAITAAVVGVILNLALFFAYHVLFPEKLSGSADVVAAVITVAALWALFRAKRSVLEVVAVSALTGLAITTLLT